MADKPRNGSLSIEWSDNDGDSGDARWGDLSDEQIDAVIDAAKKYLGEPDTIT